MASLAFMDWDEKTLIQYLKSKDINHESLKGNKYNIIIHNKCWELVETLTL